MVISPDMPFFQLTLIYAKFYLRHLVLMFGWFFFPALLLSPFLQASCYGRVRESFLAARSEGRGFLRALLLGIVSPPGRRQNLAAMEVLLGKGAPPSRALAFLLASHNLGIYFFAWISVNIGPQPMLGLYLTTLLTALFTGWVLRQTGWEQNLAVRTASPWEDALAWEAPGFLGWIRRLGTDLKALGLPVAIGFTVGVILAVWGLKETFVTFPQILGLRDEGIGAQVAGALLGSVLSAIAFMVPVGNIFVGTWLWKTHFIPYAGLLTFWIGSVLHPLTLARYGRLWGKGGAVRVTLILWVSAAVAALVVTAFWYVVDETAAALGVKTFLTERILGAPITPSRVPWFHIWFRPS